MKHYLSFIWFIFLVGLVACNGDTPSTPPATAVVEQAASTATLPPTATATEQPTNTPQPSDTPSPVPTATATATATNTATASATATATVEPTATASPTVIPTTAVPATAIPATPTLVAANPPAPPASGPQPLGPNLLINPGFEDGSTGWARYGGQQLPTYSISEFPAFVRSGSRVAHPDTTLQYLQHVNGLTPGITYRFGVWVRHWSSPNEDRAVSVEPDQLHSYVCINTDGEDVLNLPHTICSNWGTAVDSWQFVSVDGVAQNSRITVMVVWGYVSPLYNRHNEALWDDAYLGLAPVAATATPLPPPPLARPQPVSFDAVALRDSMTNARFLLEQIGGLLDRLYNGTPGSCSEFQDYYGDLIQTATYHSLPAEWQSIYNDYIFAVENGLATNLGVNDLCENGGGGLDQHGYGTARQGINNSLDRLIPAIETANSLLGQ